MRVWWPRVTGTVHAGKAIIQHAPYIVSDLCSSLCQPRELSPGACRGDGRGDDESHGMTTACLRSPDNLMPLLTGQEASRVSDR